MFMQYIWIFINQYCAIINKTQKLYFLKNAIFRIKSEVFAIKIVVRNLRFRVRIMLTLRIYDVNIFVENKYADG